MSNLSDFVGGGGGLKPFQDLGTVTGTVDLDVGTYSSFRVFQGAGDITFTVSGTGADTAGNVELWFYRNFAWSVDLSAFELVDSGYVAANKNMETLTYDQVSFDLSAQDTQSFDIAFSADGTKMFTAGLATDFIYQYSLSTVFDVSTASYDSVSYAVAGLDIFGMAFNPEGTRLFLVDTSNDDIRQYSLTTAFDLSTASDDNIQFNVTQDAFPVNVAFSEDGLKMYVLGSTNSSVYQYSLGSAFNISSVTYDSVSLDASGQATSFRGIAFNLDGSRLYIADRNTSTIFEYKLTVGFDLSTASYNNASFSVTGQDASPNGIAFNTDGTKLYMVGDVNDSVYQYTPTYDFGPDLLYAIQHLSNTTYLRTISPGYTIEEAP